MFSLREDLGEKPVKKKIDGHPWTDSLGGGWFCEWGSQAGERLDVTVFFIAQQVDALQEGVLPGFSRISTQKH